MMKLLILSTKLPYPPKDGGAIATLNLAEGLAGAGMEVDMLSVNTRKHYFPVQDIPGHLRKLIRFHAVDLDTSPRLLRALLNLLFSRQPYISERFKSKAFADRLKQLLINGEYDIVQMEGPYLAYLLPLIRNHSAAKVSLRAHNIEHEIWERRTANSMNIFSRLYFRNLAGRIRKLEETLADESDMIVAISERDRKRFAEISPATETITIPTGMDLSKYPLTDAKPGTSICFIGALDWAPNTEGLRWFLRKVMPLLLQDNPSAELHIAGRNAPAALVRELTEAPNIHFAGEVEDAHSFMRSFRLMVVPLLTGSGIRIKILEGMASGMCIVTSTIGAEGIPAESGRHLLIADRPEDFARNIQQTLANKPLQERLGSEARKLLMEKFDTFTIATELVNFYNRSE
ncbi:MAG: glycosyltransferase family 4 protein [Bacteroidales bacterium]|nr:glycosyltransferase family 4 protein [Bacteroidales bacterium]MDT8432978.1 glycosyltransferase family 4 protein [Bacteroidales bacterium]